MLRTMTGGGGGPGRAVRRALPVLALALMASPHPALGAPPAETSQGAEAYIPPRGSWATRSPGEAGFDPGRLAAAVAYADSSPIPWLKDMGAQLARQTAREPYPEILGPFRDWDRPAGMILHRGYLVASWGDIRRVDMTYSVAKSYLSTVAGLAVDRGLIPDLNAPVRALVPDGGFEGTHNSQITWHHLLNQTSEWEGTLWDKPDVADRRAGYDRTLRPPGTFWEYNDVRVNRLALALLRIWRRPLPEVLREYVMDPIGASSTWEWHGYRNSYVDVDGRRVQSVSGGSHWGGGFWASTEDHARFGLLLARRGRWGDRQVLSEAWIDRALTPTPLRPVYGYLWWLNTESRQYPNATPRSFFALGAGGNVIWIAPEHELVVVTRWMDTRRINTFMGLVLGARS